MESIRKKQKKHMIKKLHSISILASLLVVLFAMPLQGQQKTQELEVKVYPSEVKDNHFFISFPQFVSSNEDFQVKVVNLIGSEIEFQTEITSDGRVKVSFTQNIPNGIYIVRITKDRRQSTQRILVRSH